MKKPTDKILICVDFELIEKIRRAAIVENVTLRSIYETALTGYLKTHEAKHGVVDLSKPAPEKPVKPVQEKILQKRGPKPKPKPENVKIFMGEGVEPGTFDEVVLPAHTFEALKKAAKNYNAHVKSLMWFLRTGERKPKNDIKVAYLRNRKNGAELQIIHSFLAQNVARQRIRI